jgi:hypothetical protein
MNTENLMKNITRNYKEIRRRLSGMDLELLPGIMGDRTNLIARFARSLEDSDLPEARVHEFIRLIKDQNFRLEVSIADRVRRAKSGLDELGRIAERNGAYARTRVGAAEHRRKGSLDYC